MFVSYQACCGDDIFFCILFNFRLFGFMTYHFCYLFLLSLFLTFSGVFSSSMHPSMRLTIHPSMYFIHSFSSALFHSHFPTNLLHCSILFPCCQETFIALKGNKNNKKEFNKMFSLNCTSYLQTLVLNLSYV